MEYFISSVHSQAELSSWFSATDDGKAQLCHCLHEDRQLCGFWHCQACWSTDVGFELTLSVVIAEGMLNVSIWEYLGNCLGINIYDCQRFSV